MFIPQKVLEERIKQILVEDIGQGDVTVGAIIPAGLIVKAVVIAKEEGVAAGIEEAIALVAYLGLKVHTKIVDGENIKNKQVILELTGDAQTILSAERTLLNIISRMSGIATSTRRLKEKLKEVTSTAIIAATRKSAPGLLYFDKKAVIIGNGDPHRLHLDDMVLIKDNHIAIVGSVEVAVKKAKQNISFSKKIEVEVTTDHDALKAAQAGADIIMLDNFFPHQIKNVNEILKKNGFRSVLLEASGGIKEENILEYASTGVDILSLGELTHSPKALDFSLEIIQS
jgi:nicotinate-nucleotide pyrophosphorylase (carboxylating)